jgi:hypothetical protein
MKRIVIFIAIFCISLTGCKKPVEKQIIGRWKVITATGDRSIKNGEFVFDKSGYFKAVPENEVSNKATEWKYKIQKSKNGKQTYIGIERVDAPGVSIRKGIIRIEDDTLQMSFKEKKEIYYIRAVRVR